MRLIRRAARAALPLIAALGIAAHAAGQAPDVTRRGVVQRVVSPSDSTQGYALYLPSRWSPGRRWPVLVLMDPGGRAGVPMQRFQGAAERNGWIVASSYHTASDADSALALNDRAVNAIVADALGRYAADSTRLYFAGLSGTARYAWMLTQRLGRGGVAGIIGVGAGFPQPSPVWLPLLQGMRPFPYFSAAGSTDFNLNEMTRLDTLLAATALPHRFVRFEGGHEWPPADLAGRAVDWLQLQAIALGAAPRDTAWIDALYAAGLARCQALERGGALYDAWDECHALVGDFLGLRDVSAAQAQVQALARTRAVLRERERRLADALRDDEFRAALDALFADLHQSRGGAPHMRLVSALALERLQRQEADSAADPNASHTATRMLNTAFALGALQGGELMREHRFAHAAWALRVARMARPGGAGVCWPLARALAQTPDHAAAMEALGCAVYGHDVARAAVERDPMLEPLHADPRFTALISRATPSRTASDER
jgi:predicted esterase